MHSASMCGSIERLFGLYRCDVGVIHTGVKQRFDEGACMDILNTNISMHAIDCRESGPNTYQNIRSMQHQIVPHACMQGQLR